MKKVWIVAFSVFILTALVAAVGCAVPGSGSAAGDGVTVSGEKLLSVGNSQQTGIWVNGQGKVSVTPDLAVLTLGVEAQADTVSEARTQAAEAMNEVMQALKDAGVAEKDIQTRYFSIQQQTKRDRENEEQIVTGYRVTNTVTAKIRQEPQESQPLDYKVTSVIDSVAGAGGDLARIQGINFTIEDPTEYQVEAREKAFKAAKSKAEQLAELAGVTLGEPTYITEGSGGYSAPMPVPAAMDRAESASTPISLGEQEVSVNVQVCFGIE
ncbi:MAG: SIMPL domain-containing protein [Chloroflexota bacterium]